MKLTVLFTCVEQRIPPRCRKPRPVSLDAHCELEIREVTGEQTPVAIRMVDAGDEKALDYRWFGGRLWTCRNVRSARPLRITAGSSNTDYPPLPAKLDVRRNGAPPIDEGHRLYVRPGDGASMAQSLTNWAANTLIVDGVTHRPAGELRYVVMTYGRGNNEDGTLVVVTDHENHLISPDRYFGLLERTRAMEMAEKLARDRGDTQSLPMRVLGPEIEVLMPEVLKVRNDGAASVVVPAPVAASTPSAPEAGPEAGRKEGVRTMGAGVLRLVQPTGVIKALFGAYRLDVAYPGEGQAFVCFDTEWGRPTWEDVEGGLQELAESLGLVSRGGAEVHLKELVAVLAAHYRKDASWMQHLLEPESEQDVTLSELFELASVLDDGHGLFAVDLRSSTFGSRPRLGECAGGGFYQSRHVLLRSGSGDASRLGQRLDGALAFGGVDAAAEILQQHLQGLVDGVLDPAVRRELAARLGLPGAS